jgi:hypothetical protein
MRTHPCVRLFCIVDTLTSASVLPGINDIIDKVTRECRLLRSRPHGQYVKPDAPILTSLASAGALQICPNLNSKKLSCRPLDEVAREAGKLIRSPTA